MQYPITGRKISQYALIILLLGLLYLAVIFPLLEKSIGDESNYIRTDLWQSSPTDSLTLYYLEKAELPGWEELFEETRDSLFVVDYRLHHRHTVTLRDEQHPVIPFTNHFTVKTLIAFSSWRRSGDDRFRRLFLKNARWMRDYLHSLDDSTAVWQNSQMTYDKYNLQLGWPSAYAQGYGLSVLCRAFQLQQDSSFLQAAEQVLNSFDYPYQEGGILDIDDSGHYWYLEYPADPPAYVLNGLIFGLFGIYDYWRISGSDKALRYFKRGIETLSANLQRYDKGYWSAYDLAYNHFCASYKYHRNFHIPQLEVLFQITAEPVFAEYHQKFLTYLREPYFSLFKIKFSLDAIVRRLTYKNPF